MSMHRAQGWALVISALLSLLAILGSDASVLRVLLLVGAILFILGVPAIGAVQRLGMAGTFGIILIEIAAVIALLLNLMAFASSASVGGAIPFASALGGALGRIIVGWLTTREDIFPAWVGWAFIAEGLLNFISGLIQSPAAASIIGVIVPLIGAAALIGYGVGILRHEGAPIPATGSAAAATKK